MEPKLPDLPPGKYEWWDDYYDGLRLSEEPEERYRAMGLYDQDQVTAYGLQCATAERERCASMLLALKPNAIKLAAGEMTAQELRSVIAVLKWQAVAIRGTDTE